MPLPLYPEPSAFLKRQNTRPMQMLHLSAALPPTATTAPSAFCFNRPAASSACSLDPYLHRVYWLLRNHEGRYLASIGGTVLQWVKSANSVPPEHRFATHEVVKQRWLALRELVPFQQTGLAIAPVDFYAHRSAPTSWCALDD